MSQLSRPLVAAFLSASILTACGGGGSSAPAPSGVTVTAGENQVTVNWNAESGVEYWLWFKEGSSVAPGDKTASYRLKVSPPYLLTGLTNDAQYAFSVNGRKNGGEGGPGSSPLTATPRLAAGSWTTGGTLGSGQTLRSVAYGLTTSSSSTYSYVAVGDRGAIFRTPDTDAGRHYVSNAALSWITPTGTAVDSSIDLKAVVYSTGIAKYIAVGTGGNVAYSTDISNWTTVPSATTGTTATLNAIASSGSTVVAVGDNGTIRYSTNGTSWSAPASVTPAVTANLRGVTYSTKGVWVAVGTDGTVLTSTDASNWTATTQSGQLTAVSTVATTTNSVTTYYFVAVGSDGTVLTSTDASTWTTMVLGASLRTVAAGTRLVAMGSDGAIYTRELTGTTWTAQASPLPTTAMNGLIYAQNIYTAVGANSSSVYAY
ncbi:hypothetical protein [Zoogloea sp.]|uniref:WD40/YVTN/BNR-like repeat-containing protein n=1 Tax=Zoogloea sp. TaxID=49181 RepID=UPI001416E976|nr:MAG: hypothetical protein F9K15_08770 [Zoogloea sp.]